MKTIKENKSIINRTQAVLNIVVGVLMIVLGILIINYLKMMWVVIYVLSIMTSGYFALRTLLLLFKDKTLSSLLRFFGLSVLTIALINNNHYVVHVATLIFGIWALFNAGVHGLELYLKIQDGRPGKFWKLLTILFDLVLGILILQGNNNRFIINIQIGIYIITYGGFQIFSGIHGLSDDRMRWRFSSPVLIGALTPPVFVSGIKRMKAKHPEDFNQPHLKTSGNEISIYIHVKDKGFEQFGHFDLGYNGSIYSYGNYTEKGRSKHSIYGEGILICGSEVDYIEYSVGVENIVYQYTIPLKHEEALAIDQGMNDLLQDTIYYDHKDSYDSYLSRLDRQSPYYSYYKFKSHPYKRYNLFTTNCVMLAAAILDSGYNRLFNLSGIITPGAYFYYLEDMYASGKLEMKRNIHTYKGKAL